MINLFFFFYVERSANVSQFISVTQVFIIALKQYSLTRNALFASETAWSNADSSNRKMREAQLHSSFLEITLPDTLEERERSSVVSFFTGLSMLFNLCSVTMHSFALVGSPQTGPPPFLRFWRITSNAKIDQTANTKMDRPWPTVACESLLMKRMSEISSDQRLGDPLLSGPLENFLQFSVRWHN